MLSLEEVQENGPGRYSKKDKEINERGGEQDSVHKEEKMK